ncbi:MAG: S-methyl-5-thioribose-1-phosphate isomerase [Methanoregulaceae archaeon]|nr:S-methyl-5-thioribose-1-phosphate isomerase [Methanoregulaceae archaeon]
MKPMKTIDWEDGSILLIDQTVLPTVLKVVRCRSVGRLITAIRRLEIRGAPALGIAGAYGVALAAFTTRGRNFESFTGKVETAAQQIANARPTAVNLSWGAEKVLARVQKAGSIDEAREAALAEAQRIADEDVAACHALGDHGASLIPDRSTVLTHCNAGALACREWGTALGVIRSAVQAGKEVRVISCETRPLLQGSRLTAWELNRDGITVTVIPDSAAAYLMRKGRINCVLVGADRITHDALFNKVGTYMHAVSARAAGIPFYVAAPLSTFDPAHGEAEIEIEDRGRDEIAICGSRTVIPAGVPVLNPAFDATPLSLVTAIVTPIGVLRPPLDWETIAAKRRVI